MTVRSACNGFVGVLCLGDGTCQQMKCSVGPHAFLFSGAARWSTGARGGKTGSISASIFPAFLEFSKFGGPCVGSVKWMLLPLPALRYPPCPRGWDKRRDSSAEINKQCIKNWFIPCENEREKSNRSVDMMWPCLSTNKSILMPGSSQDVHPSPLAVVFQSSRGRFNPDL